VDIAFLTGVRINLISSRGSDGKKAPLTKIKTENRGWRRPPEHVHHWGGSANGAGDSIQCAERRWERLDGGSNPGTSINLTHREKKRQARNDWKCCLGGPEGTGLTQKGLIYELPDVETSGEKKK